MPARWRNDHPQASRTIVALALTLLLLPVVAPAQPVSALDADERAVSTGSWLCSRYLEAQAAQAGAAAADITSSARQFALGYVHGAAAATGRPIDESSAGDARALALFDARCAEDRARAIRDASLMAGRGMLEQAAAPDARSAPAPDSTGSIACRTYLALVAGGPPAPASQRRDAIQDWADGYINARFERAGRGLIPTARNKALTFERFHRACSDRPDDPVRSAAAAVVEAMLPQK